MALLYALLLFGFIRQGWGVRVPWSANNEFQVLFANAWDLLGRRDRLDVPWQVYLSDLLRLIPRDIHWLLPFEVLDPSLWYLRVIDSGDPRMGLMFGVVAQSVIGWDWVELALRGAVLGVVCAAIHRRYVRSTGFWATVFYLYLCVWAYYTVRATTFHVASLILWRLLPSVLVLVPAGLLLRRLHAAPAWSTVTAGLMPRARVPSTASTLGTGSNSWTVAIRNARLTEQRVRAELRTLRWRHGAPSSSIEGRTTQPGGTHRRPFSWRRGRDSRPRPPT
jgi:hypothetical protein